MSRSYGDGDGEQGFAGGASEDGVAKVRRAGAEDGAHVVAVGEVHGRAVERIVAQEAQDAVRADEAETARERRVARGDALEVGLDLGRPARLDEGRLGDGIEVLVALAEELVEAGGDDIGVASDVEEYLVTLALVLAVREVDADGEEDGSEEPGDGCENVSRGLRETACAGVGSRARQRCFLGTSGGCGEAVGDIPRSWIASRA